MPVVGNALLSRIETRYPALPVADHAPADVAILLGGALGQPLPPRVTPDMGEPGDRILHAWRLWREGKVARIIVSGGNLPWQPSAAPESELIGAMLRELGVPAEAILLDETSRNTFENALQSRAIWSAEGFRSGYLVTSAAHMPRALAVFRRAGLPVQPSRDRFPRSAAALRWHSRLCPRSGSAGTDNPGHPRDDRSCRLSDARLGLIGQKKALAEAQA